MFVLLLAGTSCSKTADAPTITHAEDDSRITLSSTNTGESIELDIEASAEALPVLGSGAEAKSLGFAYNGPKKIALELDESKTEYKGLVILRTVGQNQPNGHAPYNLLPDEVETQW